MWLRFDNFLKVVKSVANYSFKLFTSPQSPVTVTAIKLSRVGVQTFRFGRDWL